MLSEVLDHFGFARSLYGAGYYETSYHRQVLQNLRGAIHAGRLIAFTGLVGCGKTLLLRQLQDTLVAEKRVTVSKSLAVDKDRASLTTLITALFYDLSPEKEPKIPAQSEYRERALRDLVRKSKKPVVLFVDEAHDLHHKTLRGLKRLCEVVADGGAVLSIVLAGHPKLRNALLGRTWRKSAPASLSFRSMAWPAIRPTISPGCSNAAGRTMPNSTRSSSRRRSICSPPGCVRRCRSSSI
jgi:type II secretory pathway predicted ATPase ExeA